MHFYSTVENVLPEKDFVWGSWVNERPKSHEIVQMTTELSVQSYVLVLGAKSLQNKNTKADREFFISPLSIVFSQDRTLFT